MSITCFGALQLKRYFLSAVLIAAFKASDACSQAVTTPPASAPASPAASAMVQGMPMTVSTDITGSVSVDAVLLPYEISRRSFGKEVGKKYAVVSMIVSNRDPKQSLILQSAFLDYSQWLFSGSFSLMAENGKANTQVWQQQNNPSQVATAEVRTVRMDIQDAQLLNARSLVMSILSAIGTTAATLSYSTGNSLFAPSVAAFNATVPTGLALIWPDNTQTKLNLISDIGFRTNRVIPAMSSDVVIAFFPLDRFLTPTLKKVYFKAPAAFFNPSELLLENSTKEKDVRVIMDRLGQSGLIHATPASDKPLDAEHVTQQLAGAVARYEYAEIIAAAKAHKDEESCKTNSPSAACQQTVIDPCLNVPPDVSATSSTSTELSVTDCTDVHLLNSVSLNRIRVVIGGTMTIDTASVPATITSVTIDNDQDPNTWAAGKTISGKVNGTFLSGAALAITASDESGNAIASALGKLTQPADNATDAALPFTVALGTGTTLTRGSRLSFVATKTAANKSTSASTPFLYTVSYEPSATVANDGTAANWTAGATPSVTITGQSLAGASVSGITVAGTELALPAVTPNPGASTDTQMVFTFKSPAGNIAAGSVIAFNVLRKDGTTVKVQYRVPATLK